MTERCRDCGIDISNRHSNAVRCEECQKRFRLVQQHISGSARASKRYYALYKLCKTLTINELQVLFGKRKREMKYASNNEIRKLRTEMLIINQAVIEKKYEEDYE